MQHKLSPNLHLNIKFNKVNAWFSVVLPKVRNKMQHSLVSNALIGSKVQTIYKFLININLCHKLLRCVCMYVAPFASFLHYNQRTTCKVLSKRKSRYENINFN